MTSHPLSDSHRGDFHPECSNFGSFNEPLQTSTGRRQSLSDSIALLSVGDLSGNHHSFGDFCRADTESSCYDFDDGSSVSIESSYRELYKELPIQVIAPEIYSRDSKTKQSTPVASKPTIREWSTPTTLCSSISLSSSPTISFMEIAEMGGPTTEPSKSESITIQLPAVGENQRPNKLEISPSQTNEKPLSNALNAPKRVDQVSILANLQRELSKTQNRINAIRTRRRENDSLSQGKQQRPVVIGTKVSPFSHHSETHVGSTDTSTSRSKAINESPPPPLQANHIPTSAITPTAKNVDIPPVNEILVLVDYKSQNSCSTADLLDDAEDRVQFLINKLEASDDLMEALFKDLQEAQDQNTALELRNVELNKAMDAMRDGKPVNLDEFEMLMEQCVVLKYAIVAGLVLYACGQTEIFLASVVFLWLSLVVVTKDV